MKYFHYAATGKDKKGRVKVELRPNSLFACAEYLAELKATDIVAYALFLCEVELADLESDFEWIGTHPYRTERVQQFRNRISELRQIGGLSCRQTKKYYQIK